MQSSLTSVLLGVSHLVSAEARMEATVDLPGVEVKIFDTNDSFSDREIDTATQIIGTRTRDTRFRRPTLCLLSYGPITPFNRQDTST